MAAQQSHRFLGGACDDRYFSTRETNCTFKVFTVNEAITGHAGELWRLTVTTCKFTNSQSTLLLSHTYTHTYCSSFDPYTAQTPHFLLVHIKPETRINFPV